MPYYTRTYNPQPTARVTSQELKNEFQAIDNAIDAVEVDVGKGIRAPEATIALPNAASRALKVLSFDASGNPRTTIAEVDLTAAAAAAALSESNAAASAVDAALSAVAAAASAVAADASADAAAASAASIAGGPVASVNGLTGVVTLDAAAIGAQPTLVSGTDIKTLNGVSLLGSGDVGVGYLNVPQNDQATTYTLVLSDSGKHIHKSGTSAYTVTIPANASVAFPIGTAVTFVNSGSSGAMTIAITSDTLRIAGAGTTGSKTLAAYGVATAIKVTSTLWMISGSGLT